MFAFSQDAFSKTAFSSSSFLIQNLAIQPVVTHQLSDGGIRRKKGKSKRIYIDEKNELLIEQLNIQSKNILRSTAARRREEAYLIH